MDEGLRNRLLNFAARMDDIARRKREHLGITYEHGNSLLNDIEGLAEEIASAIRLYQSIEVSNNGMYRRG